MKRYASLSIATALALSFGLTACGSSDKSDGQAVTTVSEGKLTVCSNPPYAPFEDTDVASGTVIGFDIDLMAEVAKDLGLEIEPRETPFEAIESAAALEVDDCDVGASALTITDARKAKLDFSDSYYETTMGLLVRKDSGITGLADLEGKAVAVQQGTTGEEWANDQPELTEVRQFEGLGDQVTALKAGEVDGVFNDEPTLTPYQVDGELEVVGNFDTGERFGFAVKKGNTALLEQINKTLERCHNDGTYQALLDKWFAAAPAA